MNDLDLRDALLGASKVRKTQTILVTVTVCVAVFVAVIMLCSYLFAAPWHPPAPWHASYRPDCKGSGVFRTLDNKDEWGTITSHTIVCGDGYSYEMKTSN